MLLLEGDLKMADLIRRVRAAALLTAALTFLASPAYATFLGLDVGDKIDTMGLTISAGDGTFNDTTDELDAVGFMDNITTTGDSPGGPEPLLEIGGGTLEAHHKNITKDLSRDPSIIGS